MFKVRPGLLTIIGALLPLALGATLGVMTTDTGEGTLAYPMPPGAFFALSVGLAISHLFVVTAYLEVGRQSTGTARTFSRVGAIGTALVGGVEVWAGALAAAAQDSGSVTALTVGYFITSLTIAVGTVGSGLALRSNRPRLAWPLIINGLLLALIVIPVRFLGNDQAGIAALTVWSVSYVWLGVNLLRSASAMKPAESTS